MEVYSGIEEPRGPKLWREKVLYLDIRAGEPWVPSYATADGAGLPN